MLDERRRVHVEHDAGPRIAVTAPDIVAAPRCGSLATAKLTILVAVMATCPAGKLYRSGLPILEGRGQATTK
jgi:hypothetical protein